MDEVLNFGNTIISYFWFARSCQEESIWSKQYIFKIWILWTI